MKKKSGNNPNNRNSGKKRVSQSNLHSKGQNPFSILSSEEFQKDEVEIKSPQKTIERSHIHSPHHLNWNLSNNLLLKCDFHECNR